jgi:hypothetical protein
MQHPDSTFMILWFLPQTAGADTPWTSNSLIKIKIGPKSKHKDLIKIITPTSTETNHRPLCWGSKWKWKKDQRKSITTMWKTRKNLPMCLPVSTRHAEVIK